MQSARLSYQSLELQDVERFHAMLTDPFIRRYLMDGEVVPESWVEAKIHESIELMSRQGIGIWLVSLKTDTESGPIGAGGYICFDDIADGEPCLLYALYEAFTGQGYATEIAEHMIEVGFARGLPRIFTSVDAPNKASVAVLDRLGFQKCGTIPGAFDTQTLFEKRPEH